MVDYEIYHDEYRGTDLENEYWHGILFIPANKRKDIIELLTIIRKEHNISIKKDIKFAGSLKNKNQGSVIKNNLSLFKHLLIVHEEKENTKLFNRNKKDVHEKKFDPFLEISGFFGCKFILLHVPDNHSGFTKYPLSYSERVETSFRFAFKGGLHLFFSETNSINITKFYFDGNEHHGRKIDLNRIKKGKFRRYVSFSNICSIDDRQMKDRDTNSRILISFIDNIIGAWSAKLKNTSDKNSVLYPLNDLESRLKKQLIIKNKNSA
jgi:hypothetical protein